MTNPLTAEQIAGIKAATEGCTPGPWEAGDRWVFVPPVDPENNPTHALRNVLNGTCEAQANCEHIANCDPQTISALCDLALRGLAPLTEGYALVPIEPTEATASEPAPVGGIEVVELEWTAVTALREDGPHEPTGDWIGTGVLGEYDVYIFEDHYEVTNPDGNFVESHLGDVDEAKVAAQADFRTRILSSTRNTKPVAASPAIPTARDGGDEPIEAKLQVTRTITTKECPWLEADVPAGAVVYRYTGPTYGCIGPSGVAVSDDPGMTPFYELPRAALSNGAQP